MAPKKKRPGLAAAKKAAKKTVPKTKKVKGKLVGAAARPNIRSAPPVPIGGSPRPRLAKKKK